MKGLVNLILGFFGYTMVKTEDLVERNAKDAVAEEMKAMKRKAIALGASKIKSKRAKKAVVNAIAKLRTNGEKVNVANVSRVAGVARNTAKKYMDK